MGDPNLQLYQNAYPDFDELFFSFCDFLKNSPVKWMFQVFRRCFRAKTTRNLTTSFDSFKIFADNVRIDQILNAYPILDVMGDPNLQL